MRSTGHVKARCNTPVKFALRVMKHFTVLIASVLLSCGANAQLSIELNGFSFLIPEGYSEVEKGDELAKTFVKRGDGTAALRQGVNELDYDEDFLADWFHEDIVALIRVLVFRQTGDVDRLEELVEHLKSQWGEYSFVYFDPFTKVTHFINYAGAFVSLSIFKIDGHLLIVESKDLVHTLLIEEQPIPPKSDLKAMWDHFKAASNYEDAISVLASGAVDDDA